MPSKAAVFNTAREISGLGTAHREVRFDPRHGFEDFDIPYTSLTDLPATWETPWLVVEERWLLDEADLFSFNPGQWLWVPGTHLSTCRMPDFAATLFSAHLSGITAPPAPDSVRVSITPRAYAELLASEHQVVRLWAQLNLTHHVSSKRRHAA
jgi:hypothetical protein